jgi:release factor glutamine methyltransferase
MKLVSALTENLDKPFDILSNEVYPPSEDSFLLADSMEVAQGSYVLDMGTGTGILAIKATLLGASKVVAVDINPFASRCALRNIISKGLESQICVLTGDLFSSLREGTSFDVILFNPPYLRTDKSEYRRGWLEKSWAGGRNGRAIINQFIDKLPAHLRSGGLAFLIHPSEGIRATIRKLKLVKMDASVVAKRRFFFEQLLVVAIRHNFARKQPKIVVKN